MTGGQVEDFSIAEVGDPGDVGPHGTSITGRVYRSGLSSNEPRQRRADIFLDDENRLHWLESLGEVVKRCAWEVQVPRA